MKVAKNQVFVILSRRPGDTLRVPCTPGGTHLDRRFKFPDATSQYRGTLVHSCNLHATYHTPLNITYWQIIRDDTKRTFEVCGVESDVNHFTNSVHGMQRAGMNVSGLTPPVTNKFSHKGAITVPGYVREEGLYQRLMAEYVKKSRSEFFD